MANPNIVTITSALGKSDVLNVTTVPTAITTCPTDKLYKINSVIAANIDGTNAADITVEILRAGNSFYVARTISVPADSTLVVVSKDMGLYLNEGDAIRVTASANGDLQAICSYEEIA